MEDLYLISSEEDGDDIFYTVNEDKEFVKIGKTMDWSKSFTDDMLEKIKDFTSLNKPKVWTNRNDKRAFIIPSGCYIRSTDVTAIDTKAFSGMNQIQFGSNDGANTKIILSFDKRKTFYTLVPGKMASATPFIPTEKTARDAMTNLTLPDSDILFDGAVTTKKTYPSTGTVEVAITKTDDPIVVRGYRCRVGDDSRYPVIVKFLVHDSVKNQWVVLDEVKLHAARLMDRYFKNSIPSGSYKWEFSFPNTTDAVNNAKDFDLNFLNIFAEVDGFSWEVCTEEELPTKGITWNDLYNTIRAPLFNQIFKPGQLDYIIWLGAYTVRLTSVTFDFVSNGFPAIYDIKLDESKTIHGEDLKFKFQPYDPNDARLSWTVNANNAYVESGYNIKGYDWVNVTIPNRFFNKIKTPTDTDPAAGKNKVTVELIDPTNATTRYNYNVTKVNTGAVLVGTVQGNDYVYRIGDADRDSVKHTVYLNNRKIKEVGFERVPISGKISFNDDEILIGRENTITVVLKDNIGTETIFTEKFIGAYTGLLFSDNSEELLSTNSGDILKKVNYGTMMLGTESQVVEITLQNKTGSLIRNPVIKSPKDINGKDIMNYNEHGVFLSKDHVEGDVYLQLSSNDRFDNESEFNQLTLPGLAPNGTTKFYTRLSSKNPAAEAKRIEFEVTGSGTTV